MGDELWAIGAILALVLARMGLRLRRRLRPIGVRPVRPRHRPAGWRIGPFGGGWGRPRYNSYGRW